MHHCELILRADAPRREWEKTRMQGIGGSDAGTILGMNRWKSPWQLWLEKTGQAEPEDLSDNEYVYWGTKQEPLVAEAFEERTGKKVRRCGTLRSRMYPWMLANVDRMVIGEEAGLEIKTANTFAGKEWVDDEIPDGYYIQCLHYMAVTGYAKWYIAALIGGNHMVVKEIPRNEENIRILIQKEKEFWNCVSTQTPPPVDGSESCAEALKEKFHYEAGLSIELPAEAENCIREIEESKEVIDAEKERQQLAKNRLMLMMGDAEVGTIGDHRVTWKEQAGRESLSLAEVKKKDRASYEALKAAGLIRTGVPQRVMRIK